MSDDKGIKAGAIVWQDLTVPDAEKIRDFYQGVVGWQSDPVDMGGYNDYNMIPAGDTGGAAGICHAQGPNAGIPPQWLIYITVEDLDRSMDKCKELGGEVIDGPRGLGDGRFCVMLDPAGAVCALFQTGK